MKKTFDCVKMKQEIQQQLLEKMRDMTPEEQRQFTEDTILSNPKLARFWKPPKPGMERVGNLPRRTG
jgi:hypothetical protein